MTKQKLHKPAFYFFSLFSIILEPRIDSFVHWCLSFYILSFFLSQTPLLLFFLFQRGLLNSTFFKKKRRGISFLFLLLSSFLSPPDLLSQTLLFCSFSLLFEIFLWILFLIEELFLASIYIS